MSPSLTTEERLTLTSPFDLQLYNKANIEHWIQCEKKLSEPPFSTHVTTFDRKGRPSEIKVKGANKRLRFCGYNQTVQAADEQPEADPEFDNVLVRAYTLEPGRAPKDCCLKEGKLEELRQYAEEWLQSPFYFKLLAHVSARAAKMTEVKSFLCFGLGRLGPDLGYQGLHVASCYLQHIAAIRMRDVIAQRQNKNKDDIPIYVQDPAYCSNCKHILEHELGMKVLDSHEACLKINDNAFVMTVAPSYPVRQIVGDITDCWKSGGPAGILCGVINNDGIECGEKRVDQSSPSMEQYRLRAVDHNMKVEFTREKSDSSEESDDAENAVQHDGIMVVGAIFGEFGLYFKKKGT
jgi:hypothetical protein